MTNTTVLWTSKDTYLYNKLTFFYSAYVTLSTCTSSIITIKYDQHEFPETDVFRSLGWGLNLFENVLHLNYWRKQTLNIDIIFFHVQYWILHIKQFKMFQNLWYCRV
jgi:hypothetical protein